MDDRPIPGDRQLMDHEFRWRGTAASRLEGFSDAVFAIVLALLFLRSAPPENFADLKAAMKALVPFAVTFAIFAWIWVEHWLFSRRFDLRDGWITFLNLLLLFLLLFYAYPLKFLFTLMFVAFLGPIGPLDHQRMLQGLEGFDDIVKLFVFYGLAFGAIFVVLGLMYWRALRRAADLGLDRVERFLTRSAIAQSMLLAGVAVLSIVLATCHVGVNEGLPGWIYGLIGPLMALHGAWQGRRVRRLRRHGALPPARG